MATSTPTIYSDDPDPTWTFTVTSRDATLVDWATPVAALDGGTYTVTATWIGSPATTRQIRVPFVGVAVGAHHVYLRVPTGADIRLGLVNVVTRT